MLRALGTLLSASVGLLRMGRARGEETFACELRALSPEERRLHGELTRRLVAAIRKGQEIVDGYAFTVDEGALDWASLADWARLERRCCPFFRVRLEAAPHGGQLSLELGGAPDAKRFIESELPLRRGG
jgi:hypothetical protein